MVNGHLAEPTVVTNQEEIQKIIQTINKPTVQRGKIHTLSGGNTSRIFLYNGKQELGILAFEENHYLFNNRIYKFVNDPLSDDETAFLYAYFTNPAQKQSG